MEGDGLALQREDHRASGDGVGEIKVRRIAVRRGGHQQAIDAVAPHHVAQQPVPALLLRIGENGGIGNEGSRCHVIGLLKSVAADRGGGASKRARAPCLASGGGGNLCQMPVEKFHRQRQRLVRLRLAVG